MFPPVLTLGSGQARPDLVKERVRCGNGQKAQARGGDIGVIEDDADDKDDRAAGALDQFVLHDVLSLSAFRLVVPGVNLGTIATLRRQGNRIERVFRLAGMRVLAV